VERKHKRQLDIDNERAQEISLSVEGSELEQVDGFRYLGRQLVATGDNWPAVVSNLARARARWAQVSHILTRQYVSPKLAEYFYKAVVQSVLLYGCESWVISRQILRSLERFHHQVARRSTNRSIQPDLNTGEWLYPATAETLNLASLHPMASYLDKRRVYLLNWVQNRPIYLLCRNLVGGAGGSQRQYWWSRQHDILV
jgi:hypothetical protein